MRTTSSWLLILACAVALVACGDDSSEADAGADGAHDGADDDAHDHTSCGLQENCSDDAVTLKEGLVVEGDGYSVMMHEYDELTPNDDNTWMIMIRDTDDNVVANTRVITNTFSDDCMHPGDKRPEDQMTNEQGMLTIHPSFVHGGPWSVEVDVDGDDTVDVSVVLCVPGEAHGA